MVEDFVESVRDKQRIKDQLGGRDINELRISKWKTEQLNIVNTSVKLSELTNGTAFILNHSTNGKLGTGLSPQPVLGFGTMSASWTTVEELTADERITNAGRDAIIQWLKGDSVNHFNYIGYGSGSTAFNVNQTDLATAVARQETGKPSMRTVSADFWIIIYDSTDSLREIGLFNDSSSGDMLIRRVFAATEVMVITKSYAVEINISITDV